MILLKISSLVKVRPGEKRKPSYGKILISRQSPHSRTVLCIFTQDSMASHLLNTERHSEVKTEAVPASLPPHNLVPLEAVVDEEVSECVVEMGSQSNQAVGLVWVALLPGETNMSNFMKKYFIVKVFDKYFSTDLNKTSASSRALLSIMLCW